MFGRIFWPVFVVFLSFGVVACSSPKTPQNDSGTPPGDNTTQTPDAPEQGGPLASTTDNPQGCSATGCEEGFVCEISADPCVSSSCSCDEETGSWICTGDCGGGTCVPAPTSCEGENPQGCSATGCEEGFFCDTRGEP